MYLRMILREAVVRFLNLIWYGVVGLSWIQRPEIGTQHHDSEVDCFLVSRCHKSQALDSRSL